MDTYRLVISLEITDPQAATAIQWAFDHLIEMKDLLPEEAKITLVRDGDRSAANLLLPKLEGRTGYHHQTRKATLAELKPRLKYT